MSGGLVRSSSNPQWNDKGTYKEPTEGDNARVPRLEVDDASTYIDKDGSNNLTFTDAVSGTKTLADLLGGAGSDTTAIHDDTAGEIAAVTEKTSPVAADLVIIEDSAASNAKKKVQLSNAGKGIKLDDLTAPDDNTDLNASTSKHGLCPKGENSGTKYLRDDITWQEAGAEVGGLWGVNVEAISDTKTLVVGTDEIVQLLDNQNTTRIVILPSAGSSSNGDRFVIKNISTYNDSAYLNVAQFGYGTIQYLYAQAMAEFVFSDGYWRGITVGDGWYADNDSTQNLTIGYKAKAYNKGVAVGREAQGYLHGVGIGYQAYGYNYGMALGYGSFANSGVGCGYQCNNDGKVRSIAIGYRSKNYRPGELSVNICSASDQENNMIHVGFERQCSGGAGATELLAGGSTYGCSLRPSSVLGFRIIVVGRDNTSGDCAMYSFEGVAKRDGANNSTLCVVNKTVIYEDDAAWDCDVTVDDVNETIDITVTPDDTNTTQWAAMLDGVETHF